MDGFRKTFKPMKIDPGSWIKNIVLAIFIILAWLLFSIIGSSLAAGSETTNPWLDPNNYAVTVSYQYIVQQERVNLEAMEDCTSLAGIYETFAPGSPWGKAFLIMAQYYKGRASVYAEFLAYIDRWISRNHPE